MCGVIKYTTNERQSVLDSIHNQSLTKCIQHFDLSILYSSSLRPYLSRAIGVQYCTEVAIAFILAIRSV